MKKLKLGEEQKVSEMTSFIDEPLIENVFKKGRRNL
jgi:hypothetical protein